MIGHLHVEYADGSWEDVALQLKPFRAWAARHLPGDVDELVFDDETGALLEPELADAKVTLHDE